MIFSVLEGQRHNYELTFRESSNTNDLLLFNYSLFIVCGLILLPSELFCIVISCQIVNSSMKFEFIHKISVIQEKFLVLINLLRGPDITRSRDGSGPRPRVVHPCTKCLKASEI